LAESIAWHISHCSSKSGGPPSTLVTGTSRLKRQDLHSFISGVTTTLEPPGFAIASIVF
jgi:hypothetical protein